jgi:hypothetical protein
VRRPRGRPGRSALTELAIVTVSGSLAVGQILDAEDLYTATQRVQ